MKLYRKDGKVHLIEKIEVTENPNTYDSTATLINADGVVPNGGGNGWNVYSSSINVSEVYLMLNSLINPDYSRWQLNYNTVGSDNCICYIKTPEKGIITKIDTTLWWDGTYYKRSCSNFDIYGFETEANLLAFTNGTQIIHHESPQNANLKGQVYSHNSLSDKPFQYFAIKMNIVNSSDGYKSIGATKFYMRLPSGKVEVKHYGFK